MATSRLEAFSDGIFAIAATLLVLDVTADARGGALGAALEHSWPQYAAYAVSFLTIAVWWVNHHAFLELVGHADRRFLLLNIGLLACIAFLSFPTRLVAEHFRDDGLRSAAIAYGLTMTAAAVCFNSMWFYAAAGRRLIGEAIDQPAIDAMTRATVPGVPVNAAATAIAIWSPVTGLALFAALLIFYIIGSALFGRGRSPRSAKKRLPRASSRPPRTKEKRARRESQLRARHLQRAPLRSGARPRGCGSGWRQNPHRYA
jgi:TMEM175 potassium channel family protein